MFTANGDIQEKSPTVLEVETVGHAFLFLGVLKKIISDPPATASLRWLLIYRIPQQKYTWCFVNFESRHHETELCKDALQSIRLIAFNKMAIFVSTVVI